MTWGAAVIIHISEVAQDSTVVQDTGTPRSLVSVIVSIGRAARSGALELTLRSIASQSFPSIEVLVCRPHGENVALPGSVGDRFRVALLEVPDEGASAWNGALPRVSGDYICCLRAGDELLPTYLEKCLFRLEIYGEDAESSGEEPADTVPHICVVRKQILDRMGGYNGRHPAAEQRVDFIHRLASGGFVRGEVLEVLARRADPPAARTQASPALAHPAPERRSSYARLVTGWPEQRPTVLLAMPFLTMGGSEASTSQLCRQLKHLGFRVLVYTTAPTVAGQGDTTAWFEDSAEGIYHLPDFLDVDDWPGFLAYLVQQHGVTVLWLVGSSYTYTLLPGLRELSPHLGIVDLLFNPVAHMPDYLKNNYLIDRVIVEHQGMKNLLLERGEQEERIAVIPNGIDVEYYAPAAKLDWRTGQPCRAGGGPFVVAFFGRFSEEKAPDVFLEMAARLRDEPAFEFLICGIGPMEPALRRMAADLALAGRVHFAGFVRSRDYLPRCDVVVVCSRLDGRPNIILESSAMGIPVVASRVGGIAEMMPPGGEDLLCDPADPDAFAAAIRSLAGDAERYRRASMAARENAEARFSITECGSRYGRLFAEIEQQRRILARSVPPEAAAESLGYSRTWNRAAELSATAGGKCWRPVLTLVGLVRNAMLLWKVRRSGRNGRLLEHFDSGYYMGNFPERVRWRHSALLHYAFLGFRDGWNPSPRFDTRYYLSANPDVRRAGVNPLLHYVMWGEREGRSTTRRPARPGWEAHPEGS